MSKILVPQLLDFRLMLRDQLREAVRLGLPLLGFTQLGGLVHQRRTKPLIVFLEALLSCFPARRGLLCEFSPFVTAAAAGRLPFVGFVRMPSRAGGASLGLWILVGATSYLLAFLSLHQANSESFVIDLVAIGGGPLILAIVKI